MVGVGASDYVLGLYQCLTPLQLRYVAAGLVLTIRPWLNRSVFIALSSANFTLRFCFALSVSRPCR